MAEQTRGSRLTLTGWVKTLRRTRGDGEAMREALGADGMAVAVLPEARDGEKRLGLVAYGGQAGSTVGVPIFCVADEF